MTRPSFDPAAIVDLDVRDMLRTKAEPLAHILDVALTLPPGRVLHLRTTFKPVPLQKLLAGRGFLWDDACYAPDDWSTWFWRGDAASSASTPPAMATNQREMAESSEVMDLRLLPPPEPMLRIIARLEAGATRVEAYLPFYPEPLIPILAQFGATISLVAEGSDGVHVRIEIRD